jgi:hypothetical protein
MGANMPKFKVMSGEFEVVVNEKTPRKAGELAIQLHDKSKHPSLLGQLTLVEKLDRLTSKPIGDPFFISTQILLDEQTSGMGENSGQYSRIEQGECK